MERSRRNFLKVAGLFAIGAGSKPVFGAFTGADVPKPKVVQGEIALTATHWAMVIDTRQFQSSEDLRPMIEACHTVHNVPALENERHEIKWLWEETYEHAFPMKETKYLNERIESLPFLVLCNHCENPPCVRACPTKATFKRETDGVVLMDFHRCIGCRFCMAACPYGARSFNFRNPRPFIAAVDPGFPTRSKGVVEKCNFCAERLAEGKMPACVEVSDGAMVFGDLDDPDSEVRHLLKENYTIRRKQSLGTEPSVYYIV
jgi:molybdopterin-containing oxidoreductase family iron-sulfur binding subunit